MGFRNDGGESFDSHNDGYMGQGGGIRNYFFYERLNIKEVIVDHEECLWLLEKELCEALVRWGFVVKLKLVSVCEATKNPIL